MVRLINFLLHGFQKQVFLTLRYKFQPIQRYKALSAEEAEQEFGKRNKVFNYFSLMLRKRLKGDEEIESEDGEELKGKKSGGKKAKGTQIENINM